MQDRFGHLLKQTMGLDAHSIGMSAVMRAVESRARTCGIADLELYWDRITEDGAELQALIEAVVVPETWFYRDREAFSVAAGLLISQRQASTAPSLFRLLSLPCSTGEEPFTMAMAMADAGFSPSSFRIDGIDISHQALQRARTGVYGRNSFRGADLSYRNIHFTDTGQGYRISDTVLSLVNFTHGNIFTLDELPNDSFDVIFCRNLLIYFDTEDQRRAAGVLRRLLAPSGTLFVGHSEASILLGAGFSSLRIPHAFAFCKQAERESVASPIRPARVAKPKPPVLARAPRTRSAHLAPGPARPHTPAPAASRHSTLDDIRRAADRGDLDAALRLGSTMLANSQPTAEALHLLAVINEAAGDTVSAANFYRKTLYLDPDHHEALTHLALLLKRTGDSAGAQRMLDRARRVNERKGA